MESLSRFSPGAKVFEKARANELSLEISNRRRLLDDDAAGRQSSHGKRGKVHQAQGFNLILFFFLLHALYFSLGKRFVFGARYLNGARAGN